MNCNESVEMVSVILEGTEQLNIGSKEQLGSQGLALDN